MLWKSEIRGCIFWEGETSPEIPDPWILYHLSFGVSLIAPLSLAVARERNVFIMWLNSAGLLRAQSTPLTQKPNVIRNIKSSKTISCSVFPSSIWGSYSFLSPSRFMAWTSCDPTTSSIKMKNNTGKMSCRTNSRYKRGSMLMKCKRKVQITWLNGKRNLVLRVFLIRSWVFQA